MRACFLLFTICFAFPLLSQVPDNAKPLSPFVGHWEGGGSFRATAMSEAGNVTSKTDCAWSTQGHYLVCEQTLTDDKGTHQQLTIYTPSEDGGDFTYYTITGSAPPFTGKVKIEGNSWTYDNTFEQDGKQTEMRTVNTFNGEDETFKTEYRIANGEWTTMLEGKSHRTKK